jgi:Xaa-Pro aminopeptidase
VTAPSVPTVPATRHADRLARAQALLPEYDASALLIGWGSDLRLLTGYEAAASERLTMLILPADGSATLVVPRLERAAAETGAAIADRQVDLVTWEETEDPFEKVAALLAQAGSRPAVQLGALGGAWGRLGSLLVSDRLYASFLLRLQDVVPDAAFGLASSVLSDLRAIKDAEEIELLRQAAHAADRVVVSIAGGRLVGRTEADVAHEVARRLVDEGHDTAEFAIVGSGPNSASPHHHASERVIGAGEPIVLDIGGRLGGYHSDVTRTLWVTGDGEIAPNPDFARLYDVLQRAQLAACEAVAPGVPCELIDAAARSVIADAGYGDQFIHRTGHGIGLEGHEDPYMVAGNEEPLQVGHAFSVEPGIYFAGRHGARIEDIVVCAESGPDMLDVASRDLYVVRGT